MLCAAALVFGCCNCCLGFGVDGEGLGGGPGPITLVYLLPAGTLAGELLSAVTFTFIASGCIAADQAESMSAPTAPTDPLE